MSELRNQDSLGTERLLVSDLMASPPVSVDPGTSCRQAIERMNGKRISAVVVVEELRPVGIFTERDVLREVLGSRRDWLDGAVQDVMTANPFTIDADRPWHDGLQQLDRRRVRHLPVVRGGQVVGMLSSRDITHHRTGFLEGLIEQRAAKLKERNRRLMIREEEHQYQLTLARRVQQKTLPMTPRELGWISVETRYEPAEAIGGDFYDIRLINDGLLEILIADSSGHGVGAALVTSMARACYAAQREDGMGPAQRIAALNGQLASLLPDEIMSICLCRVHRRDGVLVYSSAGHPPPLVARCGSKNLEVLEPTGTLVGVFPDANFEERTLRLGRGDRVLFYTDGLSECEDDRGNQFGRNRLEQWLSPPGIDRETDMPSLVEDMWTDIKNHQGRLAQVDDMTLVAVEFHD